MIAWSRNRIEWHFDEPAGPVTMRIDPLRVLEPAIQQHQQAIA